MAFLSKIKQETLGFQGVQAEISAQKPRKPRFFPFFFVNFNQMTSFFVLKHPRGGFQPTLTLRSWPTDAGNFKFDRTSIFGKSDFWARNP